MSTSAQKLVSRSPLPPLALIEHTDFGEERPYYDEELDVAQGPSHARVVVHFGDLLDRVAKIGGYGFLADNPIWYWDEGKQKVFYADFALLDSAEDAVTKGATADRLLLACEVVTIHHPAKMRKDTETQFARNERHGVPEFLLLYPDLEDDRVMEWFTLIDGRYHLMQPMRGRYASRAVPGLVIEPMERDQWLPGQKFRVYYEGRLFRASLEEQRRGDREAKRAEHERQRAESERQRAESERQRADKLVAKLREMGIDPDAI